MLGIGNFTSRGICGEWFAAAEISSTTTWDSSIPVTIAEAHVWPAGISRGAIQHFNSAGFEGLPNLFSGFAIGIAELMNASRVMLVVH